MPVAPKPFQKIPASLGPQPFDNAILVRFFTYEKPDKGGEPRKNTGDFFAYCQSLPKKGDILILEGGNHFHVFNFIDQHSTAVSHLYSGNSSESANVILPAFRLVEADN